MNVNWFDVVKVFHYYYEDKLFIINFKLVISNVIVVSIELVINLVL